MYALIIVRKEKEKNQKNIFLSRKIFFPSAYDQSSKRKKKMQIRTKIQMKLKKTYICIIHMYHTYVSYICIILHYSVRHTHMCTYVWYICMFTHMCTYVWYICVHILHTASGIRKGVRNYCLYYCVYYCIHMYHPAYSVRHTQRRTSESMLLIRVGGKKKHQNE